MNTTVKVSTRLFVLYVITILLPIDTYSQKFIHPGINQSMIDLENMKAKVLKGEQPYKDAFIRLQAAVDTNFRVKSFTHVLRGPYGRPNIGGNELSQAANMAYNYALAWFVTKNRTYANKAIEILNAWSPVLWDFDYNDAKLLAAWTGHSLCNAAEILRYNDAGWQQKDINSFTHMLMTVYYPLMRYYYVQANGNWDGAIIHSILAIAIFNDDRKMFNNAVDHFLHAPVNGSLFKYIYPSGQCQETMRDQAHVQLGLGEFAGAAQIAFTQGVDLFSIGNNRLATGYEYTAGFLLGHTPHSYGTISDRAKTLRDDYEYVYRHYRAKGVSVPYVKQAADSVRSTASRSVLTSVRAAFAPPKIISTIVTVGTLTTGAASATLLNPPATAIIVSPGESVQNALHAASEKGGWVVLKAGVHKIPATLTLPSNVTLSGEGIHSVLFLDPASGSRDAIVNATNDMHDVTVRDLVIEGSTKLDPGTDPNTNRSYRGGYNRGGITFRALTEGQMKNINLINLTVQNCTFNGVLISGAENVQIIKCNFNENGSGVVPGPKLQHNLLLTHCRKVNVTNSRLDTSPFGSGVALDHTYDVTVTNCEIARNGYYGILLSESKNVTVQNNLIEGNDRSGIMSEFLDQGNSNIVVMNNTIQYNNGFGFESYATTNSRVDNNKYELNGNNSSQQKISSEKTIIME